MDRRDDHLKMLITPHVSKTGGLVSALRDVQDAYGFVPETADAVAADLFNLSRAEVRGVVSFYSDFSREPKGATVVRLCAAEACQSVRGREFIAAVEEKLGIKMGETSASKDVTLEPVYCLGLCSAAPAAMVGKQLVGAADEEKIAGALARAQRESAP